MKLNMFNMSEKQFDDYVGLLIDEGYDWQQIGISDGYCNNIMVDKYGLFLLSWPDKAFQVVDPQKYMYYKLRYM